MRSLSKDLRAVGKIYTRLGVLLDEPEDRLRYVTRVSRWSAAQQIQHVLIANRWALSAIVAMLRGHGEFPESGRLTLLGTVVLWSGRIPRGRAEAPPSSHPDANVPVTEMRAQVRKQRSYLATIAGASDRVSTLETRFEHSYFGHLGAVDGIRFVRVHSDHHLRIVADILAAAAS